ncbi:MAG: FHA domain-containing protein [Oscillatoriales cyanobacterium RU_3_3]|nr:FHA domain-containing protein [Microcoleus sp. SU_5_6]NJM60450.1 FHA domain-containing protein [Oscillatoriales cyanobacterium RU_3_3]
MVTGFGNVVLVTMYKLTLEWMEEGRERSQTFTSAQATKCPGAIRIGRSKEQCDLVPSETESSLSRLHVEIFLNTNTNNFWVRNLTRDRPSAKRNPIIVDGQKIMDGEIKIETGSQIQMGKITLKIRAIEQLEVEQTERVSGQPVYGIKCPSGHILPYNYLGLFCPHCGKGIQSGESEVLK